MDSGSGSRTLITTCSRQHSYYNGRNLTLYILQGFHIALIISVALSILNASWYKTEKHACRTLCSATPSEYAAPSWTDKIEDSSHTYLVECKEEGRWFEMLQSLTRVSIPYKTREKVAMTVEDETGMR